MIHREAWYREADERELTRLQEDLNQISEWVRIAREYVHGLYLRYSQVYNELRDKYGV